MQDSNLTPRNKYATFNNQYEILKNIGDGSQAKVYLCREIKNPNQYVALKLFRDKFLQKDQDSIKSIENEIRILQTLKHDNIVGIVGYGSTGVVVKPSGNETKNLVYILMEYVHNGILFDLA